MQVPKRPPRLILLLLIPICLFVGYLFVRHFLQLRTLQAEQAQLTQQLESVNQANEDLENELQYAGTDSFIEQMAREILGWVKPGEHKFVADDVSDGE
ncbi:MAG: septum formation initiator family protein [Eubacteriales bacterium]|nr:septum formation initiator family protein [Eubacteriales bacterium]